MADDIQKASTIRGLAEMLIRAEDNPFDAPFDGDTPLAAIGRELLRLLNAPGPSQTGEGDG